MVNEESLRKILALLGFAEDIDLEVARAELERQIAENPIEMKPGSVGVKFGSPEYFEMQARLNAQHADRPTSPPDAAGS